jgi:hypothetical protein
MPTFGAPKSKKDGANRRPPIPWHALWNRISHPSFLWIALGTVSAGLGAIMIWRHTVTTTPQYSVRQVALAIRQHNGTKLAYYADGAGIVDGIVDQATDWIVARRGLGALEGLDGVAEARRRDAKIQAAKLELAAQLNRTLGAGLINRQGDTAESVGDRVVRGFTTRPPLGLVLGDDHLDIVSVGEPEVHGLTAEMPVTVKYRELEVDIPIGIALRRLGPRWKVVGVRGVAKALDAINTAQVERLTLANRSVVQRLGAMLDVGAISVERSAHRRHRPTVYQVHVPLTNRSADQIIGVVLGLRPRTTDDAHATVLEVQHPIAAGSTSTEIWQFDEAAAASTHMTATFAHPERLAVHVRDIVIDSAGLADTVRLLRSYREIQPLTDGN